MDTLFDLTKGFLISPDGNLAAINKVKISGETYRETGVEVGYEAYILDCESGSSLYYSPFSTYEQAHQDLLARCPGWEYAPASGCQGGNCEKCTSSICIPEAKALSANVKGGCGSTDNAKCAPG